MLAAIISKGGLNDLKKRKGLANFQEHRKMTLPRLRGVEREFHTS